MDLPDRMNASEHNRHWWNMDIENARIIEAIIVAAIAIIPAYLVARNAARKEAVDSKIALRKEAHETELSLSEAWRKAYDEVHRELEKIKENALHESEELRRMIEELQDENRSLREAIATLEIESETRRLGIRVLARQIQNLGYQPDWEVDPID